MTAKQILEKIRETFNELQKHGAEIPEKNDEKVPTKMAKLKDGTEVQVTDLEIGGVVTINGVPAPIGEHELEDGTVIVVGDNGVITEIKAPQGVVPQPESEEEMAKKKAEEMAKKNLAMGEQFTAFQNIANQKFADYESKFADYEARLTKATKVIEGLLNLTQTLAETPTGVPDQSIRQSNFAQDKKFSDDILFS